jgi:para-nitrobenzyl esterase
LAYGLTHGVDLLPLHPTEAARAGAVSAVPLIIGTNSHEASMFAWGKPPMLPTTSDGVEDYLRRHGLHARDRVLAAYPGFPRRRACIAFGSDVMFGAPTWAFADAYSAHAPTHAYRFDHTTWTLKVLGLGATHGSEIVHIQHSYASYLGRKLHPLGRRVQPSVGRRMQRTWLDFARAEVADWPCYDVDQRLTRVIRSMRDETVSDPDAVRRAVWEALG